MILSFDQLRDLAARAGFPDPALAAAVAMGESYGHSDASNLVTPSQARARSLADPSHPVGPEWSLGIWQINNCAQWDGDTCASSRYSEASLLDPAFNAQVAYGLWQQRGWGPWGAYTNGSYRQYLPAGYAPPASPQPAPANPIPGVTPPARRDGGSTALAALGALALTFAAGAAVHLVRRRREPAFAPPPEPDPAPWT